MQDGKGQAAIFAMKANFISELPRRNIAGRRKSYLCSRPQRLQKIHLTAAEKFA
jgi:hypothetical protein